MARPTSIIFNNRTYYNASDLKLFVPTYFLGRRTIIGQKDIENKYKDLELSIYKK